MNLATPVQSGHRRRKRQRKIEGACLPQLLNDAGSAMRWSANIRMQNPYDGGLRKFGCFDQKKKCVKVQQHTDKVLIDNILADSIYSVNDIHGRNQASELLFDRQRGKDSRISANGKLVFERLPVYD